MTKLLDRAREALGDMALFGNARLLVGGAGMLVRRVGARRRCLGLFGGNPGTPKGEDQAGHATDDQAKAAAARGGAGGLVRAADLVRFGGFFGGNCHERPQCFFPFGGLALLVGVGWLADEVGDHVHDRQVVALHGILGDPLEGVEAADSDGDPVVTKLLDRAEQIAGAAEPPPVRLAPSRSAPLRSAPLRSAPLRSAPLRCAAVISRHWRSTSGSLR